VYVVEHDPEIQRSGHGGRGVARVTDSF